MPSRMKRAATKLPFVSRPVMRLIADLKQAGPVLLEPVMKVEVTTPEDYMGEIVGDLQQRRAIIAGDRDTRRDDGDHSTRPIERVVWILRCRAESKSGTRGRQHGAAQLSAGSQRGCRRFSILDSNATNTPSSDNPIQASCFRCSSATDSKKARLHDRLVVCG